ncbi:MAG: oligosaccharide flippase family protein [Phycisphaerales bacterium]|nr:oligosaccharide flippase family protein [Phycisphaerales bacterium]
MSTEANRGLVRVGSNYARLLTTLVFGIIVAPLLARWLGADALGLYLLLLAQVGLASMFHEVIRASLIRELAAAWHGERDFSEVCDAAVLVCLGVVILAAASYGILIAVIPFLNIDPTFWIAARWMLVFEFIFTVVNVLWAPATNMFVVREEFILQNLFFGIRRADYLISVLICRAAWPEASPAEGFIVFAGIAAGLRVVLVTLPAFWMAMRDRRLFGVPWRAKKDSIRAIMGTFGWNTGTVVATNLHDRAGLFIITIWFGLFGATVFGMATRLVSYIRMVTIGMTFGVDAVGARLAAKSDGGKSLQRMLHTVSRMHALMAWPAAVTAFVLADELLRLWIGSSLEDPEKYLDVMSMLVRVAALGLAARAISDGWVFLLYGAGYISKYAKILLGGGVLDPLLAIVLITLLPAVGDGDSAWSNIAGPSWAITVTFVVFPGIWLPIRGAKILKVPVSMFLLPTLWPLVLAVVLSPLLIWPEWVPVFRTSGEAWGLLDLGLGLVTYAAVYAGCVWIFLLASEERTRILRAMRGMASGAGG